MMRSSQSGFSLVTAIFLLVVLAGLLGYMINLSSVQHNTVVMAVRGAQAMQAARSALDVAVYQLLVAGTACATVNATTVNFAATEPALQSYTVNLGCVPSLHQEGPDPVLGRVTVYELTANSTSGAYSSGARANPDFVSRRIRATISILPP